MGVASKVGGRRATAPSPRPRRVSRSLRQSGSEHTGIVDQIFKARLTGTGDRRPDLDQLAETLRDADVWYVDYAGSVTEAELTTMVEFTHVSDGEPGCMTKGEILAHLITHGAAHRAGIGARLGALGVKAPSDMMTTFRRPHAASNGRPTA